MPIATASDESPDDDDPLIGVVIGDVLIVRLMDVDGLRRVYEGYQKRLGRAVTVTVMRPRLLGPAALKRLDRDAVILPHLSHPGIVQLYATGVYVMGDCQLPYRITEFVPNARTLTRYAQELSLPACARIDLFRSICDAVDYLHQNRLIHRDLKPANILVDAAGNPKVTGFLNPTRALESRADVARSEDEEGVVVGTLRYMSPEQMGGNPYLLDVRCDVYALGVVLYELLTGRLPYEFRAKPFGEVIRSALDHEPPPIAVLDETLHRDLVAIVGKCLKRDPDNRYASAGALRDDLTRHFTGERITARPPNFIDRLLRLVPRRRVTAIVFPGTT